MAITVHDLAKIAKVHHTTVCRAIADSSSISIKTKNRIKKLALKYGYQPNNIARSLVMKKTNTIGIVIPTLMLSFFPEICSGVEKITDEKGYETFICYSGEKSIKEEKEINNLLSRKVDGLIIAPAQDENRHDIYSKLIKNDVSFVFVDQYYKEIDCSYVITDDFRGAYEAVGYLIKLGHKRIAHIAGPVLASSAKMRLKGYRKALHDNNIKEEIIDTAGFYEEDGFNAMNRIIYKKPTAVFCANDMVAFGAMRAIEIMGIKIPDDISIMGYGDLQFSRSLKIPLTTVKQSPVVMGETAAKILFEKIENKSNKSEKVILSTKLVIRESCGILKK